MEQPVRITARVKTYGPEHMRGELTFPGVTELRLGEDGLHITYGPSGYQHTWPLDSVVSVTATGADQ